MWSDSVLKETSWNYDTKYCPNWLIYSYVRNFNTCAIMTM